MKLWTNFLKVHQAINSVTTSPLIAYLTRERTREIESFTMGHGDGVDDFVKSTVRHLRRLADACAKNIDDVPAQLTLKDTFAELLVFVRLFKRCPSIQKIPEKAMPTPDFKDRASRLFIEFKALNQAGGTLNHKLAMEEGLNGKIQIERQRKQGRRVGNAVQVVQPWFNPSSKTRYDPRSITYVTESLIQKVAQNLKREQFDHGPTLLLIDLSQLVLPSPARQLLAQEVVSSRTGEIYGGVLWHAAFGRSGMKMKRVIEFEGQDNKDRALACDGILRRFDYVQGLIVHYDDRFFGLAIRQKDKRKDTLKAVGFIEDICDDSIFENG